MLGCFNINTIFAKYRRSHPGKMASFFWTGPLVPNMGQWCVCRIPKGDWSSTDKVLYWTYNFIACEWLSISFHWADNIIQHVREGEPSSYYWPIKTAQQPMWPSNNTLQEIFSLMVVPSDPYLYNTPFLDINNWRISLSQGPFSLTEIS